MRVAMVSEVGPRMRAKDLRGLCVGTAYSDANKLYCHSRGRTSRYYPCPEWYLIEILRVRKVV